MKHATAAVALVLASVSAYPAFGQLPGETKRPNLYDPVADMQYTAQRGAPNATVREAQQALADAGYYRGPIDGVLSPDFKRALSRFQRDKNLRRTAALDDPTMSAIGAVGAASPATATESQSEPRR